MTRERNRRSPWPWVALGAGVAGIGAGVVQTMLAVAARTDAEETPPGSDRDSDVNSFQALRTGSYVAYGVGAGLTTLGLTLFFTTSERGKATVSVVSPIQRSAFVTRGRNTAFERSSSNTVGARW